MKRLAPSFFARDSPDVAPDLLDKVMIVGDARARIIEVEAYTQDDPASHSFRGRTKRNDVMFGPPGRLYVYLVYGMHHCVNVVTGPDGDGQAVLIRAVTCDGYDPRLTNGPGKLCRRLGIDLSFNGTPAHIVDDGLASRGTVRVTPRIGITKAVEWPRRWMVC